MLLIVFVLPAAVFADEIPLCTESNCTGTVKPDIVFFGESLPERFHSLLRQVCSLSLSLCLSLDPPLALLALLDDWYWMRKVGG
jgi:hypothetical protein